MIEFEKLKAEFPTEEKQANLLSVGWEEYVLGTDSINHEKLVVDGFVEGNPNRVFTVSEMMAELPFKVNRYSCIKYLSSNKLVGRLQTTKKKGVLVRYVSLAPSLKEAFVPRVYDPDDIGFQARQEYFETVEERSRMYPMKGKLIKKHYTWNKF